MELETFPIGSGLELARLGSSHVDRTPEDTDAGPARLKSCYSKPLALYYMRQFVQSLKLAGATLVIIIDLAIDPILTYENL